MGLQQSYIFIDIRISNIAESRFFRFSLPIDVLLATPDFARPDTIWDLLFNQSEQRRDISAVQRAAKLRRETKPGRSPADGREPVQPGLL